MRIPKGKGDGAVAPPLGGTRAAVDDGAGVADAEARDDKAVAPSAVTLSCDMPTSTHVGELRRAALRRSMCACRSVGVASGREELHEVTVAGCPELKVSRTKSRILLGADPKRPLEIGWICSPSLEIKWEQKRNVTQRVPYLARQLSVS